MRKLHLESIKTQSPVGPFSWVKSNKFKELILREGKLAKTSSIIICYHCISTGPLIPGYLQILMSHASQAPFWKVSLDHFPDGETQRRKKWSFHSHTTRLWHSQKLKPDIPASSPLFLMIATFFLSYFMLYFITSHKWILLCMTLVAVVSTSHTGILLLALNEF